MGFREIREIKPHDKNIYGSSFNPDNKILKVNPNARVSSVSKAASKIATKAFDPDKFIPKIDPNKRINSSESFSINERLQNLMN